MANEKKTMYEIECLWPGCGYKASYEMQAERDADKHAETAHTRKAGSRRISRPQKPEAKVGAPQRAPSPGSDECPAQRAKGWPDMAQRDVLIVEEDGPVCELLNQFFLACGYKSLLAKDGGEGLEVFRRSRPPLVVTVLNMPAMSGGEKVRGAGIELLKQVRQEDPDAAVIVLGNERPWKIAIESLKLGAQAFLSKPLNLEELRIAAERALERRWLLIEHRQHQQAYGQSQETDQTTRRDVLIVDDDRQCRDVLRQIFLQLGYQCLESADGAKGLEMFRESRPSLVTTDLRRPGMDGVEFLQRVREVDPDAAVIVVSAAGDARTVIKCLKLGAYAYLVKPIIIDELLITVDRASERRQLLIERRRRVDAPP